MERKRKHSAVILGLLLIVSAVLTSVPHAAAAPTGKYFDHLVTIVMENNDLDSVLAQGPYEASVGAQYSLLTGYSGTNHPSEPNYCVLAGASTAGCADNGQCCNSGPSLIDRFESTGITWKAFAEDAGSSGTCSFSPPRGGDHFGFLLYTSVNSNSARCANFLTTASSNDPEFIAAMSNPATAPNFIWLTPNDSDNAHDTSIPFGDDYLSGLVPRVLNSPLLQNTRAALFIVYDEGNDVACSNGGPDCIYASWSGPTVKKGFNSTSSYDHYSYVHTIEDNWGLQTLNSNDANAPVMSEFFTAMSGPPGPLGPLGTLQWGLILLIVVPLIVLMAVVAVASKRHKSKALIRARRGTPGESIS